MSLILPTLAITTLLLLLLSAAEPGCCHAAERSAIVSDRRLGVGGGQPAVSYVIPFETNVYNLSVFLSTSSLTKIEPIDGVTTAGPPRRTSDEYVSENGGRNLLLGKPVVMIGDQKNQYHYKDWNRTTANVKHQHRSTGKGNKNKTVSDDIDTSQQAIDYIPTHLLSDYIKISFYILTFCFGTLVNLVAWLRLLQSYRSQLANGKKDVKTAFLLLKLNLIISNLAILFVYNLTHVGWLLSYSWLAGDAMCRLCHTLFVVAYQSCSNIIAAIAVDRFRNVRNLIVLKKTGHIALNNSLCFVKCLVIWSWLLAVFLALPQILLWKTVEVSRDWHQCVSVWDGFRSATIAATPQSELTEARYNEIFDTKFTSETVYTIFHVLTVFWIPFILATVTYSIMIAMLLRLSSAADSGGGSAAGRQRRNLLFGRNDGTSFMNEDSCCTTAAGGLSSNTNTNTELNLQKSSTVTIAAGNVKQANGGRHQLPSSDHTRQQITNNNPAQLSIPTRNGKFRSISGSSDFIKKAGRNNADKHDKRRSDSCAVSLIMLSSRRACDHEQPATSSKTTLTTNVQRRGFSLTPSSSSGGAHCLSSGEISSTTSKTGFLNRQLKEQQQQQQQMLLRRRRSWHGQMRQKAMRTTGLIITMYSGCWLPYNVISLVLLFRPNSALSSHMAEHLDWLKGIMVLNAVINPFLYGFKQDR